MRIGSRRILYFSSDVPEEGVGAYSLRGQREVRSHQSVSLLDSNRREPPKPIGPRKNFSSGRLALFLLIRWPAGLSLVLR